MGFIKTKIYILHGWTYSLDKWNKFTELLKKDGFDPVFLRIPGLTQESDKVWDVQKYSEWLDRELSKDTNKVILLGHSNGGRIAGYFTAEHPDKVKKLILVDAAGIYHKEFLLQIKRFIFRLIAKVGKRITKSEFLKKILYRLAGESDYLNSNSNMKKTMQNLIDVDLTPILKEIPTPTLIVWGDEDKATPLSDAKLINKYIKNSELKIIKGAKHVPFYTHPKEVVDIIKNDL